MGDSIIFWAQQAWREEDGTTQHRYPALNSLNVQFHGVQGLKLHCIPPLLQEKIEQHGKPDVLLIHCGSNNIGSEPGLGELSQLVSDVLTNVFVISKNSKKPFKVI